MILLSMSKYTHMPKMNHKDVILKELAPFKNLGKEQKSSFFVKTCKEHHIVSWLKNKKYGDWCVAFTCQISTENIGLLQSYCPLKFQDGRREHRIWVFFLQTLGISGNIIIKTCVWGQNTYPCQLWSRKVRL